MSKATVLLAEDDLTLLELMAMALEKEGYDVSRATTARELESRATDREFDLVISDIYLGDGSAIDLLDTLAAHSPDAAIILMTAQGTVETVAAARDAGVFDYLAKPFEIDVLIERARESLTRRRNRPAKPADRPQSMIIGSDPKIVEVYKAVTRVAPLPLPVLIRGETGTGKELVARALHRFGTRREGPFVAVNCGAIPAELLESELFGHRKGAFTGATSDSEGSIRAAAQGTLFLDEVGELPPPLQVKLLRFLQDGEIQPIGSSASVRVPVRVLAATHREPAAAIAEGRMREDFYYRLAGYEIVLPPLRERAGDIPDLVEHFRTRFEASLSLDPTRPATTQSLRLLQSLPWPGNVRELESVVRRALVDLGGLDAPEALERIVTPASVAGEREPRIGDDLTLAELEKRHIERVLTRCGGNRTRAARILGIERKSLYRKARRFGIAGLSEDDP